MTSDAYRDTKRVRMADIAQLAGVSTATVSRALADNPVIPQELRDRIATLAREKGYVVDQQARGLRLQRTQTIGIVIPLGHESKQQITDPFFQEMVSRLADEITLRGFEVLLSKVSEPTEGWLDRIVQSKRCDGVLIIGQSDQHAVLNAMAATYRPMVVWGGDLPDRLYCTVGVDNRLGARLAVQHLIDNGRRRIAFLGMPDAPEVGLRREGYLAALAEANLPPSPELLVPTHFTLDTAQAAVEALIDSNVVFDALFAASDLIAVTAIQALTKAGRSVPEDVSVIGFDDIALARYSSPPLSTIRQDLAAGAKAMVDMVFRRIAGEDTGSLFMTPELVRRAT